MSSCFGVLSSSAFRAIVGEFGNDSVGDGAKCGSGFVKPIARVIVGNELASVSKEFDM